MVDKRLLSPEEIMLLIDQLEDKYENTGMTDAEWELKSFECIAEAQHAKDQEERLKRPALMGMIWAALSKYSFSNLFSFTQSHTQHSARLSSVKVCSASFLATFSTSSLSVIYLPP